MTTKTTKDTIMGTTLSNYIRATVRADIRLFLAPLVGAIKGIRQEVQRVQVTNTADRKRTRS